ncbi:MAG: response regulator [Proteobacteria bacterium]|nr:response regulator [Pseudomonadota bacterium]
MSDKQKLESIGLLASTVAHDLNNILTGILGHVSYLRVILSDNPTSKDSIRAIEDAAKKAAAINQQVLDFAKGHEGHFIPHNLIQIIQSAIKIIKSSLPEAINLTLNYYPGDYFVLTDESQLSQIIMNLAINAADAMPGGGDIVFELESVDFKNKADFNLGLEKEKYVLLKVRDNGSGIPKNIIDKIFEPFFTTKQNKGTGLGLSIVRSIVNAHGGELSVISEQGRGTEFRIYLPQCENDQSESAVNLVPEEIPTGSERILVVDDEEAVRAIVQRSLEHLGYHVTVACNGEEAFEIFSNTKEKFNLIIIDMIMPKMPGDQLFKKMKEVDPDVPVLIASGFSSDARTKYILDNGGLGFLQKPFTIDELAIEVRNCLDN